MDDARRACTSCETPLPADAAFCPRCGSATPTDISLEFGEGFGGRLRNALAEQYRIERELGRGGMAVVFLATDLKHDRSVAVKVLRPEVASTLGAQRFLREIQIAAKLHHPHIVMLIDSGVADEFLYYVMPYVEGESLRQRLNRERQLPLDDALLITCEVGDALSVAHSRGVVHRDIKPENILLSGGHAFVVDFGVARAVTMAGGSLTTTGGSVGTPLYMSPEQASADSLLDGRSDVYSLGCVLFEMLAGETPYTGPTLQAIVTKHALSPVPDVRTLRDTVTEALERVVRRSLAKSPADRFRTIAEFIDALTAAQSAVSGDIAFAAPSPPPSGATPTPRGAPRTPVGTPPDQGRRRRWALLASTFLLVAAVALAFGLPRIRTMLGGATTRTYADVPSWGAWTEVVGEHFPVVAAAGSLLVVHRFGADSVFAFDGRRWKGSGVPNSFSLRPLLGTVPDGRLLATKERVDASGTKQIQYWWLAHSTDGVEPLEPISDFEPDLVRPFWWSDGREVVTWLQAIMRRTPTGWEREPTGTAGQITTLWGRDVAHRFALAGNPRDSILVHDGISWQLEDILPDRSLGTPEYNGGTTLPDGTTVVFGSVCDAAQHCALLILQQDSFGGPWRRVPIPSGAGIPPSQEAEDGCVANQLVLAGVAGEHARDYYVWGDWATCDPGPPRREAAGCPDGQPCIWHVDDGTLEPVTELIGNVIAHVVIATGAPFALVEDGSVWRRVGRGWRAVERVPDLPPRLLGASPVLVVRSRGGEVRYEPGSRDTLSGFFVSPVTGATANVTDATPPQHLVVRDSSAALLTADGAVFISKCGIVPYASGLGRSVLRCRPLERLPPAPGRVGALGLLADGGVIGVGVRGLIVTWQDGTVRREQLPSAAHAESLWGVLVSDDGTAAAIGANVLLERDTGGVWTEVRRFPGALGTGEQFAVLPDGDVVIAGPWIRVWDRSADSVPKAVLHQPITGQAQVSALHVLPDGRLVAGFAHLAEPRVGGWLTVWSTPVRDNRSERVDLPLTVDVTDLADDGRFLLVVGRGGSMTIPLDSLPFAREASKN